MLLIRSLCLLLGSCCILNNQLRQLRLKVKRTSAARAAHAAGTAQTARLKPQEYEQKQVTKYIPVLWNIDLGEEKTIRLSFDNGKIIGKRHQPLFLNFCSALRIPDMTHVRVWIYLCGAVKYNLGWPKTFYASKIDQPKNEVHSKKMGLLVVINVSLQLIGGLQSQNRSLDEREQSI